MPTRFITLSDCPFCLCSHIKRKVGFEEESAAYLCGHEKFLKDSKLCLRLPGGLMLHDLTVCCWHDEFPETSSSALSPCWQQICIIYFLSPHFYPKASLLANEFQ